MASAEIFLPARISGSTRALNAALPARAIGGAPIALLFRLALTPPARASSCTATIHMKRSTSVPPYCSGKPEAKQPDRRRLFIEFARKPAGLVPGVGIGLDFLLDKTPHHVAKRLVVRGIERARCTGSVKHGDGSFAGRCPESGVRTCVEWLRTAGPPQRQTFAH
jgi:hypothetical protein